MTLAEEHRQMLKEEEDLESDLESLLKERVKKPKSVKEELEKVKAIERAKVEIPKIRELLTQYSKEIAKRQKEIQRAKREAAQKRQAEKSLKIREKALKLQKEQLEAQKYATKVDVERYYGQELKDLRKQLANLEKRIMSVDETELIKLPRSSVEGVESRLEELRRRLQREIELIESGSPSSSSVSSVSFLPKIKESIKTLLAKIKSLRRINEKVSRSKRSLTHKGAKPKRKPPGWRGQSKRHSYAAKKGWKRRKK